MKNCLEEARKWEKFCVHFSFLHAAIFFSLSPSHISFRSETGENAKFPPQQVSKLQNYSILLKININSSCCFKKFFWTLLLFCYSSQKTVSVWAFPTKHTNCVVNPLLMLIQVQFFNTFLEIVKSARVIKVKNSVSFWLYSHFTREPFYCIWDKILQAIWQCHIKMIHNFLTLTTLADFTISKNVLKNCTWINIKRGFTGLVQHNLCVWSGRLTRRLFSEGCNKKGAMFKRISWSNSCCWY